MMRIGYRGEGTSHKGPGLKGLLTVAVNEGQFMIQNVSIQCLQQSRQRVCLLIPSDPNNDKSGHHKLKDAQSVSSA